MKRALTLSAVAGALIIAALAIGAAPPADKDQDTPAQVKELRKELDSLRMRLEKIERQIKNTPLPSWEPWVLTPRSVPQPGSLPKGSRRFEYNGMSFYICPLGHNAARKTLKTK